MISAANTTSSFLFPSFVVHTGHTAAARAAAGARAKMTSRIYVGERLWCCCLGVAGWSVRIHPCMPPRLQDRTLFRSIIRPAAPCLRATHAPPIPFHHRLTPVSPPTPPNHPMARSREPADGHPGAGRGGPLLQVRPHPRRRHQAALAVSERALGARMCRVAVLTDRSTSSGPRGE